MVLTLPLPLPVLKTSLEKELEKCCSTRTSLSTLHNAYHALDAGSFWYSSLTPTCTLSKVIERTEASSWAVNTLSCPQFSITSLSLPLSLIRKITIFLDNQLVCSKLRPHHQGLRYSSLGKLRGGKTMEDQRGGNGWSGSLWTSQVLILYCLLQWLPGRTLTWSQRMWPYFPPHLNPYHQHRLKIKASTVLFISQPWGKNSLNQQDPRR